MKLFEQNTLKRNKMEKKLKDMHEEAAAIREFDKETKAEKAKTIRNRKEDEIKKR